MFSYYPKNKQQNLQCPRYPGQTCAESQFFKEKSSQVIQKSSHDFDFFGILKKSQKKDFEFF
jgi:hypothetical protein